MGEEPRKHYRIRGRAKKAPLRLRAAQGAFVARCYNRGENLLQIKPNKTKQKSLDLLGFIWFTSSESDLFNELQAKKLKKIPSISTRVSGCGRNL
jgi:hypothetical protein